MFQILILFAPFLSVNFLRMFQKFIMQHVLAEVSHHLSLCFFCSSYFSAYFFFLSNHFPVGPSWSSWLQSTASSCLGGSGFLTDDDIEKVPILSLRQQAAWPKSSSYLLAPTFLDLHLHEP